MSKENDVGYGKPPVKHQFKKGKSGNPSGRPKLPKRKPPLDFQQNLIAELKSPITIIENGKKKEITTFEAFMKSVIARALKGDKAPTNFVLNFIQKLPKYAFEEDEVVWVTTKKQVEEFEKLIEDTRKAFPELCEPDSYQEQGNGSPSSPGSAADSGSASTDT
jgi:hypothetical protein